MSTTYCFKFMSTINKWFSCFKKNALTIMSETAIRHYMKEKLL